MVTSMIGCHCTGISLKNSLKLLPIPLKNSSIGWSMDLVITDETTYEWNVHSIKITIKHSLRHYSHKTFCTPIWKNSQSECHIQWIGCSDWTILFGVQPSCMSFVLILKRNSQSEYHFQWLLCSDWMILEYKYKIHTRKFYDSEVWSLRLFDVCVLSTFVLFFYFCTAVFLDCLIDVIG